MSKNNVTCYGKYYNFKKGFEICKNKHNCVFYDEEEIYMVANCGFNPVFYNYIRDFRKCEKFKSDLIK